jgi:hypothetical protein
VTKLPSFRCALEHLSVLIGACLALSCFVFGQVTNQDIEVEVHGLPSLMAKSKDPTEVLLTSLDTVIHDGDICCGKDSALADSVSSADPESLKDVATRIDGRHLLSDGRPIVVKATYLAPEAINTGLIATLSNQHAALLEWNSHLYVLYGAVYLWVGGYDPEGGGGPTTSIHKLLLWDTRYFDSRRSVVFNRETDDVSKLQGMLLVEAKLQ